MFALCTQVTFCEQGEIRTEVRPRQAESIHLAVVLEREVEGEAAEAFGLGTGGHLQTLDYARVALVLETRVFAFCVLTDDGEVDVVVTGGEARERLAQDDRRVDVELLTHGDVPRDVAGLRDGGEEDPCKPEGGRSAWNTSREHRKWGTYP